MIKVFFSVNIPRMAAARFSISDRPLKSYPYACAQLARISNGSLVAEALSEAWFVQARHTEARQVYPLVREAALRVEDEKALKACLLQWGEACIEQSDYAEAEALLAEHVQICEFTSDRAGMAAAKYHLARIAIGQSQYTEAEHLLTSCRLMREESDDVIGLAAVYYQQARILSQQGEHGKAEELGQQALVLQNKLADQVGTLRTLRLLAWNALYEKQDYPLAGSYCEQALTLSEELQDQGEFGAVLYDLSVVYRYQGDLGLAQKYAQDCFDLFEHIGDRKFQGLALYSLSIIQEELEEYSAALETGLKSVDLLREVKDKFDLIHTLMHVGDLYQHLAQTEQAHTVWAEALDLAKPINYPWVDLLYQRLDCVKVY